MENFKFYLDRKITIWQRDHFTINAKSIEDATKRVKEEASILKEEYSDIMIEGDSVEHNQSEFIFETEEFMFPEENKAPTIEIYTEDGECIYENYNEGGNL